MTEDTDGRDKSSSGREPALPHGETLGERILPLKQNQAMWQALAGNDLLEMLKNREATREYLAHNSWRRRLAAISILSLYWGPDASLARICEKMSFDDPHPQVRATALFTLAYCYRGTNDVRVGRLLAMIARDGSLSNEFRKAAYSGLFWLRDVPLLERPRLGQFRFPEEVDWSFVASFLLPT